VSASASWNAGFTDHTRSTTVAYFVGFRSALKRVSTFSSSRSRSLGINVSVSSDIDCTPSVGVTVVKINVAARPMAFPPSVNNARRSRR